MNRIIDIIYTSVLLAKGFQNIRVIRIASLFILMVMASSCTKEFTNPYDPATPPDIWMPKAFKLDTLGTNALRLTWQQDELHIDGFAIHKTTNGQMKVILLPLDSLRFTDTQAVDTSSDVVCPELSYKVMARAGNNRSLEIGTTSGIRMPLSTPTNAGTDILVTDTATTVQLNAQSLNVGERGQWTIVSGIGGSFSNLNVHNSNFTGSPCTDYVLRWTKTGCSETFDEVNVKFQKVLTIANAGANQMFTDGTTQATLNANNSGAGESGVWTIISGAGGILENPSSPNTLFIGQSCSNYLLRWTINDACNSSFDEMNVNFKKTTTTANAGTNQIIISNATQVTLAANSPAAGETGTWSIVSGAGGSFSNVNSHTSNFTGSSCTSYTLRWTIQGLCSNNYNDVNITFQQGVSQANAGTDQNISSTTFQANLAGNALMNGEYGFWTVVSGFGGVFSNPELPNSIFTGIACQNYTLKWSKTLCIGNSSDNVDVSFIPTVTTSDAGFNILANTSSLSLSANSPNSWEVGVWTIVSGQGGTISNINHPNAIFTGVPGQIYQLAWSINSCLNSSMDLVTITYPISIPGSGVSDIDGNQYSTQIIGSQEWMSENLKTSRFCNGELIPNITSNSGWSSMQAGAYSIYSNSQSFNAIYGKIYNGYTVSDIRNVCPCGWHVPSHFEWVELSSYLGGNLIAGGKMKATGLSYWSSPNYGATNSSGFAGLPGGDRMDDGGFVNINFGGLWWASTQFSSNALRARFLEHDSTELIDSAADKKYGLYIRCVKN